MLPYRVPVLCYGLLPESEPGFPARLAGAVGEFVAAHDMPDDAQLRPVVEAAGRALTSAKRGRLRR
jgi:hypothetical protein